MSLSVWGTYCSYSTFTQCSPLSHSEVTLLLENFNTHKMSRTSKSILKQLLTPLKKPLAQSGPAKPHKWHSFPTILLLLSNLLKSKGKQLARAPPPTNTPLHTPSYSAAIPTRTHSPSIFTTTPKKVFHLFGTTRKSCPLPDSPNAPQTPPQPPPLPLKIDAHHQFGVPDVRLLKKHKFQEALPSERLKVREMMRHSSHIFKRYNRLMGRALTLLWKYAASQPQSIERVGMDLVRGFLDHLRCTNLPVPTWGELDIEGMFPCLDRAHIPLAIQFFSNHACQQSPKQELTFRIHEGGIRSLDTIGCKKSDPAYYQFSVHDVSNFLSFELLFNDYFTHFLQPLSNAKVWLWAEQSPHKVHPLHYFSMNVICRLTSCHHCSATVTITSHLCPHVFSTHHKSPTTPSS